MNKQFDRHRGQGLGGPERRRFPPCGVGGVTLTARGCAYTLGSSPVPQWVLWRLLTQA